MEQDRAPAVFRDHEELAGPPPGELSGRGQSDRGDDHGDGATGAGRPRWRILSDEGEGHRYGTGKRGSPSSPLPRRVELHDQASSDCSVTIIFLRALTLESRIGAVLRLIDEPKIVIR